MNFVGIDLREGTVRTQHAHASVRTAPGCGTHSRNVRAADVGMLGSVYPPSEKNFAIF